MTQFTDEDLKRCKEYVETCIANQEKDRGIANCILEIPPYEYRALIARLQAAEAWCEYSWSVACNEGTLSKGEVGILEVWRKAAGR